MPPINSKAVSYICDFFFFFNILDWSSLHFFKRKNSSMCIPPGIDHFPLFHIIIRATPTTKRPPRPARTPSQRNPPPSPLWPQAWRPRSSQPLFYKTAASISAMSVLARQTRERWRCPISWILMWPWKWLQSVWSWRSRVRRRLCCLQGAKSRLWLWWPRLPRWR